MEEDKSIFQKLTDLGFNKEDCLEASQSGINVLQEAIDWILDGKPSIVLQLKEMGFNLLDSRQAVKNGKTNLQDAMDWILAGKPAKTNNVQESAIGQPTLKLGQTKHSTSLSNQVNPFSSPIILPDSVNATAEEPMDCTNSTTSSETSDDKIESRMHMNDEQKKIKEKFEEKQRNEARKKAIEEKRNKQLEKQKIKKQIEEDRQRKKEITSAAVDRTKLPSTTTISASNVSSKSASLIKSTNDNDDVIIQVRFPNGGQVKRQVFKKGDSFLQVIIFAETNWGFDRNQHCLVQPFPHVKFTNDKWSTSLEELGLFPNGNLSVVVNQLQQQEQQQPQQQPLPSTDNEENPIDDDRNDITGRDERLRNYPFHLGPATNAFRREHSWGEGHVLSNETEQVGESISNEMAADRNSRRLLTSSVAAAAQTRLVNVSENQTISQQHHRQAVGLQQQPQNLTSLILKHICKRLVDNHAQIYGLNNLPAPIASSIIDELKSQNNLRPKLLEKFIKCHISKLNLDCYKYLTNELLQAIRYHVHLNELNLNSSSFINDNGLLLLSTLKNLQSLSLAGNPQITDNFIPVLKNFNRLEFLNVEKTSITNDGISEMSGYLSLNALKSLNLSRTKITEDCLPIIGSGLINLNDLNIESTNMRALWGLDEMAERLKHLNIASCPISTDSIQHISKCKRLVTLNLHSTNINADVGLKYFKDLLELERLELPNRLMLTSQSLQTLTGLPLHELDLTNCVNVDDSVLIHVGKMMQLKVLRLSNVKVTTSGLQLIKGVKNLKILDIDRTLIDDDVASVIGELENLLQLNISSTSITDKFLESTFINRCLSLTKLNLSRTEISNAGLSTLKLPNLKSLNLTSTNVDRNYKESLKGCPNLHNIVGLSNLT